jgi:hypothetical protein
MGDDLDLPQPPLTPPFAPSSPQSLLECLRTLAVLVRPGEPARIELPCQDGAILEITVQLVTSDSRRTYQTANSFDRLAAAIKDILQRAGRRMTKTAIHNAVAELGIEVSERKLGDTLTRMRRAGTLVNPHDHQGYGLPGEQAGF